MAYRIASKSEVRVETHSTRCSERGCRLTTRHVWGRAVKGDICTLEKRFEEELAIKFERRAVEGSGRMVRNDLIGVSDCIRSQKVDDLVRREARVSEAGEDGVDCVCRSWNETIQSGSCSIGTTSKELKSRCTRAISEADCCSEINQISGRDIVASQEWCEGVCTVTGTVILSKSCLYF